MERFTRDAEDQLRQEDSKASADVQRDAANASEGAARAQANPEQAAAGFTATDDLTNLDGRQATAGFTSTDDLAVSKTGDDANQPEMDRIEMTPEQQANLQEALNDQNVSIPMTEQREVDLDVFDESGEYWTGPADPPTEPKVPKENLPDGISDPEEMPKDPTGEMTEIRDGAWKEFEWGNQPYDPTGMSAEAGDSGPDAPSFTATDDLARFQADGDQAVPAFTATDDLAKAQGGEMPVPSGAAGDVTPTYDRSDEDDPSNAIEREGDFDLGSNDPLDPANVVAREGDFDLGSEPPLWSGPASGDGGKIPVEYLPGEIGGDGVIGVPSPGDFLTDEREAGHEWLEAASAAAAEGSGEGGDGDGDDDLDDQNPHSQSIDADPTPSFTATDDLTNIQHSEMAGGGSPPPPPEATGGVSPYNRVPDDREDAIELEGDFDFGSNQPPATEEPVPWPTPPGDPAIVDPPDPSSVVDWPPARFGFEMTGEQSPSPPAASTPDLSDGGPGLEFTPWGGPYNDGHPTGPVQLSQPGQSGDTPVEPDGGGDLTSFTPVDGSDLAKADSGPAPVPSEVGSQESLDFSADKSFGLAEQDDTEQLLTPSDATASGTIDFSLKAVPEIGNEKLEFNNTGGNYNNDALGVADPELRGDEVFALKIEDPLLDPGPSVGTEELRGDEPFSLKMEDTGLGETDDLQSMTPDDDDDPLDGI